MTPKRERTFIQVQIDPAMKTKFIDKLPKENKTITDVLIQMIEDYLDESEQIDVVNLKNRVEILERVVEKIQSVIFKK